MAKKRKLGQRATNPLFVRFAAITMFTPALLSMGIEWKDIDTWNDFLNVVVSIVMNPFLLGSTIMGAWIFFKEDHPEFEGTEEEGKDESN